MNKYNTISQVDIFTPVTIETRLENAIINILRFEKLSKFQDVEYILKQSIFCNELCKVNLYAMFHELKKEICNV
jgi:hypothetical protein